MQEVVQGRAAGLRRTITKLFTKAGSKPVASGASSPRSCNTPKNHSSAGHSTVLYKHKSQKILGSKTP